MVLYAALISIYNESHGAGNHSAYVGRTDLREVVGHDHLRQAGGNIRQEAASGELAPRMREITSELDCSTTGVSSLAEACPGHSILSHQLLLRAE